MPGFEERHAEALESGLEALAGFGASERTAQAFRVWAGERESQGMRQAARKDYQTMLRQGREAHEERLGGIFSALNQMDQDPGTFADAARQLEESYTLAVGQGLYAPEEASQRLSQSVERLREQAFNALYGQNPDEALRSLDALGFDDNGKTAARARFEADQAAEAAREEPRKALRLRYLDLRQEEAWQVAVQQGDFSGLRLLAQNYAQLGDNERARESEGRAVRAREHAAAARESAVMPLGELRRRLDSLEQSRPGDPEREELLLRYEVYEERLRDMLGDPARAVQAEVGALLDAEDGDAARSGDAPSSSLPLVAGLRLAAQDAQGLPWRRQRALTNAEAARYREAWLAGSVEERRAIAVELEGFGEFAGMAAREMGLSPVEQALIGQSAHDPRARVSLATMLSVRLAGGEAKPQSGDAPDGQAMARSRSHIFRALAAAAEALPRNAEQALALDSAASSLDAMLRRGGTDAERAAADMDGGLRSVVGRNFALLYTPAVWISAGYLQRRLTMAGESALPAIARTLPTLASEHEREMWTRHLRENGIWLNAPDWRGYVLYERISGHPVQDGQGRLFRVRQGDASGVLLLSNEELFQSGDE
jgi:hypothetical protein